MDMCISENKKLYNVKIAYKKKQEHAKPFSFDLWNNFDI